MAITLGDGPAYPVLGLEEPPPHPDGVVRYENTFQTGRLRGLKVLWAVAPAYRGPVLVRGDRLDRPGIMRFQEVEGDPITPSLRMPPRGRDRGWLYYPSSIRIAGTGCYAFHVEGTSFTDRIVFEVVR